MEKVDATPTWLMLLPAMLDAYAQFKKSKKFADAANLTAIKEEFYKMAKAADLYNEKIKHVADSPLEVLPGQLYINGLKPYITYKVTSAYKGRNRVYLMPSSNTGRAISDNESKEIAINLDFFKRQVEIGNYKRYIPK